MAVGRYGAFVAALEEGSRDNLDWVKERALRAAADLLKAKPEAEAQLLSLLVNKLGDPSRKLASRVGACPGSDTCFRQRLRADQPWGGDPSCSQRGGIEVRTSPP